MLAGWWGAWRRSGRLYNGVEVVFNPYTLLNNQLFIEQSTTNLARANSKASGRPQYQCKDDHDFAVIECCYCSKRSQCNDQIEEEERRKLLALVGDNDEMFDTVGKVIPRQILVNAMYLSCLTG